MHQPLLLAAEIEYSAMLRTAIVPESNRIIPPFESALEIFLLRMPKQKIKQHATFLVRHILDVRYKLLINEQ